MRIPARFLIRVQKYDNGSEDEPDFIAAGSAGMNITTEIFPSAPELPQCCSRPMSEGGMLNPFGAKNFLLPQGCLNVLFLYIL